MNCITTISYIFAYPVCYLLLMQSFLVMKGHVMFQINEQKYDVAAGEAVVRVPTGIKV